MFAAAAAVGHCERSEAGFASSVPYIDSPVTGNAVAALRSRGAAARGEVRGCRDRCGVCWRCGVGVRARMSSSGRDRRRALRRAGWGGECGVGSRRP